MNSSLQALRMPGGGAAPGAVQGRISPVCPCCQIALQKREHRTGMAWRCARCGGESLNFSQFRRMIPELHANEIWLTVMEQPVRSQAGIRCPECRQDMAAVLVPFQGREIELDLCAGCQRLWMMSGEDRPWSLDAEPSTNGPKPPVLRLKGRGVARRRPDGAGHGSPRKETQSGHETKIRLWILGTLIAVFWFLLHRLGW